MLLYFNSEKGALLEPRAKVLIYGQSTLTGPTSLQTEEIEENFEQKEAKTDQELRPRHHHSVESFPERDLPRLRMLLESPPRSELWPRDSLPISLLPLLPSVQILFDFFCDH
jgi:hypothetical protein